MPDPHPYDHELEPAVRHALSEVYSGSSPLDTEAFLEQLNDLGFEVIRSSMLHRLRSVVDAHRLKEERAIAVLRQTPRQVLPDRPEVARG